MPIYDLTCPNQHIQEDVYLNVGERPPCPTCGGATETVWLGKANGVIPDEIPGGLEIRHGLCNEDGSPRKYYSWTEIKREAKKRGLVNRVEHVGLPGSDKSPHTVRWA